MQRKMAKKALPSGLVHFLGRSSPELLGLVVTFLRKLSVVAENAPLLARAELGLVPRLGRLVTCGHEGLTRATLRLCYNLSFVAAQRAAMAAGGLVPKFVELLKRPPFRAVTLRLLYHLSCDDGCKPHFFRTPAIPIVMQVRSLTD